VDDYAPGAPLTGTLPDGIDYSIRHFIPSAAAVTAGGGGFVLANVPGYTIDYNGVEVSLVKRLSQRWMGRVGFSYNDSREHFSTVDGMYDTNGNPTRTVNEPLVDGGQHVPQASVGTYLNAKWQFSANGMYQRVRTSNRREHLRAAGLSLPDLPRRDARRRHAERPGLAERRFVPARQPLDDRPARREGVPHPAREPAAGRRSVQRVQCEHRARPRQQHRRDELQCADDEPEPEDFPGGRRARLLTADLKVRTTTRSQRRPISS
jgi:hypothetical protein